MKLDVVFTPKEFIGNKANVVVVIDVLRATSTICKALANDCKGVIPVSEIGQAREVAESIKGEYLLCGERQGLPIKGFALGNSPLEYTRSSVSQKYVILTTTNGTRAIDQAKVGARVITGCFLNISSVVTYCIKQHKDITILCAGREGAFSLEDSVCAGMIVSKLQNNMSGDLVHPRHPVTNKGQLFSEEACNVCALELNDSAVSARILYEKFVGRIDTMLSLSNHGKYLESIGQKEDLSFCGKTDVLSVVPILQNGILTA